jgi:hypothetical protein
MKSTLKYWELMTERKIKNIYIAISEKGFTYINAKFPWYLVVVQCIHYHISLLDSKINYRAKSFVGLLHYFAKISQSRVLCFCISFFFYLTFKFLNSYCGNMKWNIILKQWGMFVWHWVYIFGRISKHLVHHANNSQHVCHNRPQ